MVSHSQVRWRFVRGHDKLKQMGVASHLLSRWYRSKKLLSNFACFWALVCFKKFLKTQLLRPRPLGKCLPGRLSHQAAHNMRRVRYLKNRPSRYDDTTHLFRPGPGCCFAPTERPFPRNRSPWYKEQYWPQLTNQPSKTKVTLWTNFKKKIAWIAEYKTR